MKTNLEMSHSAEHQAPLSSPVRRILTTTDFSSGSKAGTDYAIGLAKKFGSEVVILHVIESLPPLEGMEAFPLIPAQSELVKQANSQLKQITHLPGTSRLHLITRTRFGKPFRSIIAAAGEHATDLIVMATHGYTGLKHTMLGSTAEWVVRHAPCSVLTVPSGGNRSLVKGRALKISKILVPLDFSELSKTALPWACFLARSFDAEVILVNVTEIFPMEHLLGAELMNHAFTPLMKDAEINLQRIAENLPTSIGAKAVVAVRAGIPYKEICQVAQDSGVELIVLTTHGYTGLKHMWLGSTAERIVRSAQCPVLVVRQIDQEYAENGA
jgi:nucleotide-binding universal stress UspA family protein